MNSNRDSQSLQDYIVCYIRTLGNANSSRNFDMIVKYLISHGLIAMFYQSVSLKLVFLDPLRWRLWQAQYIPFLYSLGLVLGQTGLTTPSNLFIGSTQPHSFILDFGHFLDM